MSVFRPAIRMESVPLEVGSVAVESRVIGDKSPRSVCAAIGDPNPELVKLRVRHVVNFAVKKSIVTS